MTTETEITVYDSNDMAVIEKVDPTPAGNVKTAMERLEALYERFASLATVHMPAHHFMILAGTRMSEEPKLPQCRFDTLYRSLLQCFAWGLDPTGKRNGAFLVPRWNSRAGSLECSLQLGYGALIDLVTRDGRVKDVDAQVVYPDDRFEVSLGTETKIIHVPNMKSPLRKRNGGVCYYAIATLDDSDSKVRVMTRGQVEEVRDGFAQRDRNGKFSPAWEKSFDEMACKTVVLNLCKMRTVSPMAARAVEYVQLEEFSVKREPEQPRRVELEVAADATPETAGMQTRDMTGQQFLDSMKEVGE